MNDKEGKHIQTLILTDSHREVLKQSHNHANNILYSHYKAPCYDFVMVQAHALRLLTALNPGTVCIAGVCCLNACGEGSQPGH